MVSRPRQFVNHKRLAGSSPIRENDNPAPSTTAYERQAEPVIELQLEKEGVRLAYLLGTNLVLNPVRIVE